MAIDWQFLPLRFKSGNTLHFRAPEAIGSSLGSAKKMVPTHLALGIHRGPEANQAEPRLPKDQDVEQKEAQTLSGCLHR